MHHKRNLQIYIIDIVNQKKKTSANHKYFLNKIQAEGSDSR